MMVPVKTIPSFNFWKRMIPPVSSAETCFGLSPVWLMCSNRMGHYATMATRIRRSAFEKTLAPGDRRGADSLLRDVLFRLRLGPRLPHGPRTAVQFLLAAFLDRADVGVHGN